MIPVIGKTFSDIHRKLVQLALAAPMVDQDRWQGIDVSQDPAARCYELRNVCFEIDLQRVEDLDYWKGDIKPNLPWADNHFLERVSGKPLNPGVEWANWPWSQSADKFRRGDKRFNHTYMERLWPKYARMVRAKDGHFDEEGRLYPNGCGGRKGIDRHYGDLDDLVNLLVRDSYTRQAFIPLFFPEDTGWGDGGRKMCSLGYQFLRRDNYLHIWYPLRSCDLSHHWADDCYLSVRLLLWVLEQCRDKDSLWNEIVPGTYAMHMTSLHVFEVDRRNL